jgi:hypothetical protein
VDVDLPPIRAGPFGVDGHHHTLGAEAPRRLRDPLGVLHRRRVDAHLVRPGPQQGPEILHIPDPPADGEGDGEDLRHATHHLQQDPAVLDGGGDIQEDQLVGPFLLIKAGVRHRVPGVAQVNEPHPLNHPPGPDIQTRDDAPGQSHIHLPFDQAPL